MRYFGLSSEAKGWCLGSSRRHSDERVWLRASFLMLWGKLGPFPLGKMVAGPDILHSMQKDLGFTSESLFWTVWNTLHPQALNKVCVPNVYASSCKCWLWWYQWKECYRMDRILWTHALHSCIKALIPNASECNCIRWQHLYRIKEGTMRSLALSLVWSE